MQLEIERSTLYPIGARLSLAELDRDPYPAYAAMRVGEPVSWVRELGMWYVTDYATVSQILLDSQRFTTTFERSTVNDILGCQMLTLDGPVHDRYKKVAAPSFTAAAVRQNLEASIREKVRSLLSPLRSTATMEFRSQFASRLPIQVVLDVFRLEPELEGELRRLFDALEQALSNFRFDPQKRAAGKNAAHTFHTLVGHALQRKPASGLLATLAGMTPDRRLTDEEICRNAGIIFFGAISTVEALLLNCLWSFHQFPEQFAAVRADRALIPKAVEETMRWLSPVQSAHRVALQDVMLGSTRVEKGEVVSCMLGAANRDPTVFGEPDEYRVNRQPGRPHLGFAAGAHYCLGLNLARAETRIAIEELLALQDLTVVGEKTEAPQGWEFRQPRRLQLAWQT